MILSALLFGAAIIAGTGIVAHFWNNLVEFLKKSFKEIQKMVSGIVYGAKVFLRKTKEGIEEISKYYEKENGQWNEYIKKRPVPENQVPPEILERAKKNEEVDITDEVELKLKNAQL